ncbi:hypothetical protein HZC30_02805 [Candidatus Woesearchaeota archaeon]|nr:hypothetical protein [Candidatus Woesearchaeota archaeon]
MTTNRGQENYLISQLHTSTHLQKPHSLEGAGNEKWNSVIQWEYALDKFKDDVKERVAKGILIESKNSTGNEIHWNMIEGNSDFGFYIDIPSIS